VGVLAVVWGGSGVVQGWSWGGPGVDGGARLISTPLKRTVVAKPGPRVRPKSQGVPEVPPASKTLTLPRVSLAQGELCF